ncbi:MAG: ABC transporter ATP-binding protein [Burkholderiales bacterium]|nr:ABC transporter ATP-binding protein [Burkholderiales bacterium]
MIRCHRLAKSFRRARVLDGLDLEIGLGERVALIGSNGAGKTTLMRCLLGEYTHEGEVTIDGRCPRRERTAVLARVGFVPQLPPPLKMPVGQLVDFATALTGTPAARVHDLAERLGLDLAPIRTRPFVKLSGGMKQKLLIAIALGRDASVLIMDEPAANLDAAARRIFFELLAEREARTTMLISSHRINEISALVNRVVELDMGQLVLDERIAGESGLAAHAAGRVVCRRSEPALARALEQWNFRALDAEGIEWEGEVAGPDRLRFLGTLSRYVSVVSHVSLQERGAPAAQSAAQSAALALPAGLES